MVTTIADRQNDQRLLRLHAAARHFYDRGQFWHRLRVTGTVAFVALGVVVTFRFHGAADYIAAAAGGWILFARTVFDWLERRAFSCGAKAQEQYDSELFGLSWNKNLAGRRLGDEDIVDAARGIELTTLRDWYPLDVDEVAWPRNAVLCQRSSAAWGRRTHTAYAVTVAIGAFGWLLVTVVIGVAAHASLSEYLIRLFLPSQPALMDGVDLVRTHARLAKHRERVEASAEELLLDVDTTGTDSRALQDQIFEIRRRPPRVPNWFYRLRRDRDERAMREAAGAILARMPR
jgi:hypothetical protein